MTKNRLSFIWKNSIVMTLLFKVKESLDSMLLVLKQWFQTMHRFKYIKLSILDMEKKGSVRLSGQVGVRFAPWPRHTEDVKNSTYC